MFVKVTNGAVSKFPYTLGELRRENPNTSFPKVIPDSTLAEYGVYTVQRASASEFDNKTHCAVEGVENVDGIWTQTWTIKQLPQSRASMNVRNYRNRLLAQTDWTALSDVTMSSDMQTYRQSLRDLPSHENWPYLADEDWPTKP